MKQPFTPIPESELKSYRGKVHVEGWNGATVFLYQGTDKYGVHSIITPKPRKVYRTKNRLLYTRSTFPAAQKRRRAFLEMASAPGR